ncbi:MAG TPA: hypothetical protein VGS60_19460 [Actinomycetes bacterium]|jgi:hypothetical protein|nr:hypothetical protein [Actinomycetes bacterium]
MHSRPATDDPLDIALAPDVRLGVGEEAAEVGVMGALGAGPNPPVNPSVSVKVETMITSG